METLLKKALNLKTRKIFDKATDEQIDLGIAWAEKKVNLSQVSRVLGIRTGSAMNKMALFLRAGFEKGKIIKKWKLTTGIIK